MLLLEHTKYFMGYLHYISIWTTYKVVADRGSQVQWYNDAPASNYANSVPVRLNKAFDKY